MKYIPKLQNGKTIVQQSDNTRTTPRLLYNKPIQKLNTPQDFAKAAEQRGTTVTDLLINLGGKPTEKKGNYWDFWGGRLGTNLNQLGNLGMGVAKTVGASAALATGMAYTPATVGTLGALGKGLLSGAVVDQGYSLLGGKPASIGEIGLGAGATMAMPLIGKGLVKGGKVLGEHLLEKSRPYLMGDKSIPMISYKPKSNVIGYENPLFPRDFEEPINNINSKVDKVNYSPSLEFLKELGIDHIPTKFKTSEEGADFFAAVGVDFDFMSKILKNSNLSKYALFNDRNLLNTPEYYNILLNSLYNYDKLRGLQNATQLRFKGAPIRPQIMDRIPEELLYTTPRRLARSPMQRSATMQHFTDGSTGRSIERSDDIRTRRSNYEEDLNTYIKNNIQNFFNGRNKSSTSSWPHLRDVKVKVIGSKGNILKDIEPNIHSEKVLKLGKSNPERTISINMNNIEFVDTDVEKINHSDYINIFNNNIHKLNDIIKKNNTSGQPYKVKKLWDDGTLEFDTGSKFSTQIVPGKFYGEVADVNNYDYFKYMPGLNMVNTTNSVFDEPVRGTRTYESINEYLKLLNLGRVKPGFNSQTKYSYGLWSNAIVKDKASGYKKLNEDLIYGAMKGIIPAIGTYGLTQNKKE